MPLHGATGGTLSVVSNMKTTESGPHLSPEQVRTLEALQAMGVVDEAEFRGALHFLPQFGNLESDLTYYLRNHSGPSIWLNAELDSYCRGTYAV